MDMPNTESAVQLKDGIQEEIIEEAEDLQNVTGLHPVWMTPG